MAAAAFVEVSQSSKDSVVTQNPIDSTPLTCSKPGHLSHQEECLVSVFDREMSKAGLWLVLPVMRSDRDHVCIKFHSVDHCERFLDIVSEPDLDPKSLYNCIRHYSAEEDYWGFDFEYDDLGVVMDDECNETPTESSPEFHAFPFLRFPNRHLPKVIERLKIFNGSSE